MSKKLIIIESPNKIKKIKECVGSEYEVIASVGHIMDLDKKKLGFDIETFEPRYVVSEGKTDVVKKIKDAAKTADEIYICSDPDREGESIAFNVLSLLSSDKNVYRSTFKELTKKYISDALKKPVGFNEKSNQAQQTRRITDRLVGFKISPMLWARGGMKGVSAGRTQSAALKFVVDREKDIRAFVKKEYWSIKNTYDNGLVADLSLINSKEPELLNEADTETIRADLENCSFTVSQYDKKKREREPYPPFITSTLQMEAGSKLGWGSKRTMDAAQAIFSKGLITYHRTDSERIEPDKLAYARDHIEQKFGKEYLSDKPRQFLAKDGSQDAHECIRPTFEPEPADLSSDEKKLLRLIENRFLASQMAPAEFNQVAVKIAAKNNNNTYELKANGSVLAFDGFIKVYGSDAKDSLLPPMNKGDVLTLKEATKTQHFTKPPARFNDASMVALLKTEGIGRPSTYASIPETLLARNYIEKEKNSFKATELGIMVSDYLSSHFPDLIAAEFTSKMEEKLDLIESGNLKKNDVLQEFYNKLLADIEVAKTSGSDEFLKTSISCKKCSGEMIKKASNSTVFLGCSNYPACGHTVNYGEDGALIEAEVETGYACPLCSSILNKKNGQYGSYFSCSSGKEICAYTASVGSDGSPVEKKKAEVTEHKCPNCKEGFFVKRVSKSREFYGCNKFPKCKTAMNIGEDGKPVESKASGEKKSFSSGGKETGESCPKCKEGKLLLKKGKFGDFVACNRFSEGCKHTAKVK